MSNNYPPGCCKKLISKHNGQFDFQKAELCFPFESTPPAKRSLCFLMTVLKIFTESNPFKQWRKIWGFRGQEGEWSELPRRVSERFSVFYRLAVQSLSRVWLWPHGLQRAWLLCPSRSPEICSDLCLLGRWCYLTTSSSAFPPGSIVNATAVGGALLGSRMAPHLQS